jgi:hypothetical protein
VSERPKLSSQQSEEEVLRSDEVSHILHKLDVSSRGRADRARADSAWGGTPAALGNSGATHDLACDQQTASEQHLRDLARLRRVRDRMDREYAQPLDVEALGRGVNLSAGHFSREFRRAHGESPYS